MIQEIVQIIGLACLVNIFVEAEPIKRLKAWAGISISAKNGFVSFTARLLACPLCLGTWVGMIALWNLETGAIVAVLAEIISRKLNTFEI